MGFRGLRLIILYLDVSYSFSLHTVRIVEALLFQTLESF